MEVKEIIYIIGAITTPVLTFLGTRNKLKDDFKDQIHNLELKLKDLTLKDELQQQVIEQIGRQMDDLVPKLIDNLNERNFRSKKIKK